MCIVADWLFVRWCSCYSSLYNHQLSERSSRSSASSDEVSSVHALRVEAPTEVEVVEAVSRGHVGLDMGPDLVKAEPEVESEPGSLVAEAWVVGCGLAAAPSAGGQARWAVDACAEAGAEGGAASRPACARSRPETRPRAAGGAAGGAASGAMGEAREEEEEEATLEGCGVAGALRFTWRGSSDIRDA